MGGTLLSSLEVECSDGDSCRAGHRKRFIERSSKVCGLDLSQGLEQLVYENVDSLTILN